MSLEQHLLQQMWNEHQNRPPIKLLFPEGCNEQVQQAALALVENNFTTASHTTVPIKALIEPTLLVTAETESLIPFEVSEKITIKTMDQTAEMAEILYEMKKDTGLALTAAKSLVACSNYYGMLLLKLGQVDCLVGGADYTSAEIFRPALRIIGKKSKFASSVFIMNKATETYLYTDCSLNINVDSDQLVANALLAIDFAKSLKLPQFNPQQFNELKVAMLSFSTAGSASSPSVTTVQTATQVLQKASFDDDINVHIAGEIQYDAAIDETVRNKKCSELTFAGSCNIFVFPNLEAGNICYKAIKQSGHFNALGPITLGFKKPVSDLSRSASVRDIYGTAIATCYQAVMS